jgi:hypothetical protein
LIATCESRVGDQILPDRHGISAATQTQLDGLPEGIAGGGSRGVSLRRHPSQLHAQPGGHLIGRFWRFVFSLLRKVFCVGVGVASDAGGKRVANRVVVRSVLPFESCGGVTALSGGREWEPIGTGELLSGCGGWI